MFLGNLKFFERVVEKGNFEVVVKLGIVYFYNEGLFVFDEVCVEVNGLKVFCFFSFVEWLNVGVVFFIWFFICFLWLVSGSCCKVVVYESFRVEC